MARGTDLAAVAKAMQGRKRESRRPPPKPHKVEPTPERAAKGDFISAGMAARSVPVIDTLRDRKQITPDEHEALKNYREKAYTAHRSEVKSNLDRTVGGGGDGVNLALTHARLVVRGLDGILGALQPLVFAVTVEDKTLRQWCMDAYGTTESGGKLRPVREVYHMALSLEDLKRAARRLPIGA